VFVSSSHYYDLLEVCGKEELTTSLDAETSGTREFDMNVILNEVKNLGRSIGYRRQYPLAKFAP